jgi:hypothetical protein
MRLYAGNSGFCDSLERIPLWRLPHPCPSPNARGVPKRGGRVRHKLSTMIVKSLSLGGKFQHGMVG